MLAFLNTVIEDLFAVCAHEVDHKVKVVDGGEREGCDLFGFEEVVDIGGGVLGAGRAGAAAL